MRDDVRLASRDCDAKVPLLFVSLVWSQVQVVTDEGDAGQVASAVAATGDDDDRHHNQRAKVAR